MVSVGFSHNSPQNDPGTVAKLNTSIQFYYPKRLMMVSVGFSHNFPQNDPGTSSSTISSHSAPQGIEGSHGMGESVGSGVVSVVSSVVGSVVGSVVSAS